MPRENCCRIPLAALLPAQRPAPISLPTRPSTPFWALVREVSGTKSNGTMRYNSLQAVLQKEIGHGLQYQVSYTFSKCMSDNTGYYGAWNNALSARAYWQNVYDQRSEYAPCYYDATHVLSSYAVYDLPVGRGKMLGKNVNAAVNEVIGGWAVSPIVSFRTGWPIAGL